MKVRRSIMGGYAASLLVIGCGDSVGESSLTVCESGQIFCVGNAQMQCSVAGDAVVLLKRCDDFETCTETGCVAVITQEYQETADTIVDISTNIDALLDGSDPRIDDGLSALDNGGESQDAEVGVGYDVVHIPDTTLTPIIPREPKIVQIVPNDNVGGVTSRGSSNKVSLLHPRDVVFTSDETMYIVYSGGTLAGSWVVQRSLDGNILNQWFETSCVPPQNGDGWCTTIATVNDPPRLLLGGLGGKHMRVHMVGLDGVPIHSFGPDSSHYYESEDKLGQLTSVEDLCVHQATGRIYAVDHYDSRVVAYSLDGTPLFEFGGKGYAKGQIEAPSACAVAQDKIYVEGAARITVFDLDGNYVKAFGSPLGNGDAGTIEVRSLSVFESMILATSKPIIKGNTGRWGFHWFTFPGEFITFWPADFSGVTYYTAHVGPNGLVYVMRPSYSYDNPNGQYVVLDFGLGATSRSTD